MASISFIAVLIGAAGVAGGIEAGDKVGFIVAGILHIGGIVGMAIARWREGEKTDEDEDGISCLVDKPGHAADR